MADFLPTLMLGLAAVSLIIAIISVITASNAAREARSTIFPIVRENQMVRAKGGRYAGTFFGVMALVFSVVWFLLSGGKLLPTMPSPAPQPVQVVLTQSVVQPSPTSAVSLPSPTAAVVATPTLAQLQPPATDTPVPIPQPAVTVTATTVITPLSSYGPAPTEASLSEVTFATQLDDRRRPIDPRSSFPADTPTIYAEFSYDGMRNGDQFTSIWYRNEVEYARDSFKWNWGLKDRSYVAGYINGAGTYRLELYVNSDKLSSGQFTVTNP